MSVETEQKTFLRFYEKNTGKGVVTMDYKLEGEFIDTTEQLLLLMGLLEKAKAEILDFILEAESDPDNG